MLASTGLRWMYCSDPMESDSNYFHRLCKQTRSRSLSLPDLQPAITNKSAIIERQRIFLVKLCSVMGVCLMKLSITNSLFKQFDFLQPFPNFPLHLFFFFSFNHKKNSVSFHSTFG